MIWHQITRMRFLVVFLVILSINDFEKLVYFTHLVVLNAFIVQNAIFNVLKL